MPQLVVYMEVSTHNKHCINLINNRFNPPTPRLRRARMRHAAYSNRSGTLASLSSGFALTAELRLAAPLVCLQIIDTKKLF